MSPRGKNKKNNKSNVGIMNNEGVKKLINDEHSESTSSGARKTRASAKLASSGPSDSVSSPPPTRKGAVYVKNLAIP